MFKFSLPKIDVIKYKWLCIAITALLVIPGIVAMIYLMMTTHAPLKLGIDYTGGTIMQYSLSEPLAQEDVLAVTKSLQDMGLNSPSAQKIEMSKESKSGIKNILAVRIGFESEDQQIKDIEKINSVISQKYPSSSLIQTTSVGPTLSKELFKNSFLAILLAFAGIVLYLTIRFQLDYAIFALLALVHDALFVCGAFAILGIFYGTQIDGLFITAILTLVGFSVHDTIVVYDRIRENLKFSGKKLPFAEVVNISVNQTLARSINTSLTSIITLLALYFFGGVSTKDFVLAMILGILVGTYSSIFFSSMLLADHRSHHQTQKA